MAVHRDCTTTTVPALRWGRPAKVVTDSGSYGYYPPSAYVQCTHCGARTAKVDDVNEFRRGNWERVSEGAEVATALWNRRAEHKQEEKA